MDLSPISKAVAGGVISLLVAEAARFGFHASAETVSAVSVIVTGAVAYLVGHLAVYFAPKNADRG